MGTKLRSRMLVLIILNTLKSVHSTEETICTYNITLPTAFNGDLQSTTATISVYPATQLITAEIKDIEYMSLGGITRMDFAKKILLIRSVEGSRCSVYTQFPNISLTEMENKLKIAPVNKGRIQDLVCTVSAYVDADTEHPQEVNKFCDPDNTLITALKDCKPYNPDDSEQHTVPFCLRSGIQDHTGLSCNRGGHDSLT